MRGRTRIGQLVLGAALLIIMIVSLIGCEEPPSADPLAKFRLSWRQLEDGSHFGRSSDPEGENSSALRCWPDIETGYRCLGAHIFNSGAFRHTSISNRYEADLPRMNLALGGASDGYSCSDLLDYREEISRRGEVLVSNTVSYGSSRWSSEYVADFMADNGVEGQPWFECLDILHAVNRGSLETLSTTEITRDMIE